MARSWRFTKLSIACALLRITRVRVCAMHPFYSMGSQLVSASYLLFLAFVFCCCFFAIFLSFLPYFVFMLSLELGRCSSDIFLSSRPRTGLATACITRYG